MSPGTAGPRSRRPGSAARVEVCAGGRRRFRWVSARRRDASTGWWALGSALPHEALIRCRRAPVGRARSVDLPHEPGSAHPAGCAPTRRGADPRRRDAGPVRIRLGTAGPGVGPVAVGHRSEGPGPQICRTNPGLPTLQGRHRRIRWADPRHSDNAQARAGARRARLYRTGLGSGAAEVRVCRPGPRSAARTRVCPPCRVGTVAFGGQIRDVATQGRCAPDSAPRQRGAPVRRARQSAARTRVCPPCRVGTVASGGQTRDAANRARAVRTGLGSTAAGGTGRPVPARGSAERTRVCPPCRVGTVASGRQIRDVATQGRCASGSALPHRGSDPLRRAPVGRSRPADLPNEPGSAHPAGWAPSHSVGRAGHAATRARSKQMGSAVPPSVQGHRSAGPGPPICRTNPGLPTLQGAHRRIRWADPPSSDGPTPTGHAATGRRPPTPSDGADAR